MRLLIVDDEAENREYLAAVTTGWGFETIQATDGEHALELMANTAFDLVLSDLVMPKMDGFELLTRMREAGDLPPTVVMTAFGGLDAALRTIHELNGFWFLEKPVDLKALKLLLERAGTQRRLARENEELKRQLTYTGVLGSLVGQAPAMREIFSLILRVGPTSAAVLITGESGTGKELVARALHANSRISDGPFVAINCAALPESLIESEIFGHEKGAFTGALERRIGALEAAQGGTLFLDELGEMPLAMQAKFLRVLEDLRFRRLGGKQEIQSNARVVAATNRDPHKAIRDGALREDLFYRLNVFQIHLPPLRERKEDIPLMVETMIRTLNAKHGTQVEGASPAFLEALSKLPWDGNVRELRNVIERAVIIAGEGMLEPRHAAYTLRKPLEADKQAAETAGGGLGVEVGMTIDDAEKVLIQATLAHTGNNKTRAASILGISTKTMHVKLRQYRIQDEGGSQEEPADA